MTNMKLMLGSFLSLFVFVQFGVCKLWDGDMEISVEQELELKGVSTFAGIKTSLWPKVIPYKISEKLAKFSKATSAITDALKEIEEFTCIRFQPRNNETGFILFDNQSGKCFSPVGYVRSYKRMISLGPKCWYKGVVLHHLMHTLGFMHENNRPDRDLYIKILLDNIVPGMERYFHKYSTFSTLFMNLPYDYDSITHFGRKEYGNYSTTIEPLDYYKKFAIGQRRGLSEQDKLQVNLLYRCPGFTQPPNSQSPPPPTTKPVPPVPRVQTVNVCGLRRDILHCPYGHHIWVEDAFYGRDNQKVCTHGKLQDKSCAADKNAVMTAVKKNCQGKMECQLEAYDRVFGDPCPGTFKFLQVKYRCSTKLYICQLSATKISCPPNQKLHILDAMFGRMSTAICPSVYDKNSNCKVDKALETVRKDCEGQKSCKVYARDKYFGYNPCPGTYKYAEVIYHCENE